MRIDAQFDDETRRPIGSRRMQPWKACIVLIAAMLLTSASAVAAPEAADARPEAYTVTLPEAVERLQLAVRYLKDKGYRRIAIVSHNMGSRLSYAYMKRNPVEIDAWAALGMPSARDGHAPALIYSGIRAPVLDLYGANDLPQVIAGAALRRVSLAGNAASKQIVIAGSDHFFAGHERAMVNAVETFLDGVR